MKIAMVISPHADDAAVTLLVSTDVDGEAFADEPVDKRIGRVKPGRTKHKRQEYKSAHARLLTLERGG